MRKITLFLLMAVCVVVLLTTEPCEGKRNTDVAPGEGGEGEADGDKPIRRGRLGREKRPGQGDEQPGENGNGKAHGRRHRHHGRNNKPRDGDPESSTKSEE